MSPPQGSPNQKPGGHRGRTPQGRLQGRGTFAPAQRLQQDVVLAHFLLVVLELPPQLVQLLAGELPRGLRLGGANILPACPRPGVTPSRLLARTPRGPPLSVPSEQTGPLLPREVLGAFSP